jgi:hypothetical protein
MYGARMSLLTSCDLDDVRVLQAESHASFAQEQLDLFRFVAITSPQDFQGHDSIVVGVDRAIHAGKGAGAADVQHPVLAVEVPLAVAFDHLVQLEIGQQLFAQQLMCQFVGRHVPAADLRPHRVQLPRIQ